MTTKRKPITRNIIPEITSEELFHLSDGLLGELPDSESLDWFLLNSEDSNLKKLWDKHKDYVLEAWIKKYPGTRPCHWWKFSAPQIKPETIESLGRGAGWVERWREEYCEPRRRIGGIGTPRFECLAHAPHFHCGIPDSWITPGEVITYSEMRAEQGEDPFPGVAIDPSDPPLFECQAHYLRRHGLLTPEEKRRLKPKDFEPEAVMPEPEEAEPASAGSIH